MTTPQSFATQPERSSSFESEDDLTRYSNDEERQRVLRLKHESVRGALLIKGTLA